MSSSLKLTMACGDYEIIRPLKEGRVKPDGIELTVLTRLSARERHWRMAKGAEFDICEYNAPSYVMAHDRGTPYTALPVFLHRRFRHGFVFIKPNAGIEKPSDLAGCRIGGTNFSPAANIWMRGILEEHHGVSHRSIIWITERPEEIAFEPPEGLRIHMVGRDKSLDDMLLAGEIDGLMQPTFPRPFLEKHPGIVRLWPDHRAEELRYWHKTGIFPIMHLTLIRSSIVKENPWVVGNLMTAFEESKRLAYQHVQNPRVVPLAWFSTFWEEQADILGPDPWAYGLTPQNRENLETMVRYTYNQGLIDRRHALEDMFEDCDLDSLKRDNLTF